MLAGALVTEREELVGEAGDAVAADVDGGSIFNGCVMVLVWLAVGVVVDVIGAPLVVMVVVGC